VSKPYWYLLLCTFALPAAGQQPDPIGIAPGARLRVSVDSGPPIVGSVVRLTPNAVDLRESAASTRHLSTASVTSLEISRGRPVTSGRVARGALNGFLIVGGAATLVILAGEPGYAFVGPLVFGPPGALAGGLLAARKAPEQWQRMPVTALAAAAEPGTARRFPGVATTVAPQKRIGRRLGIGALLGAVGGTAYASTNDSSTPMGTKVVMFGAIGALVGAGVGALWP